MLRIVFFNFLTFLVINQEIKAQEPDVNINLSGYSEVSNLITGSNNRIVQNTINYAEQVLELSEQYKKICFDVKSLKDKLDWKILQITKSQDPELDSMLIIEKDDIIGSLNLAVKTKKDFETAVIELAETFINNSHVISERFRKAKKLFEKGKIQEADSILNEAEMEEETARLLHKRDQVDKDLENLATEWLIKAKITKSRYDFKYWFDSTKYYHQLAIKCSPNINFYSEYADFLAFSGRVDSALHYHMYVLNFYTKESDSLNLVTTYRKLGELYSKINSFKIADSIYIQASDICLDKVQRNDSIYKHTLARIIWDRANLYQRLPFRNIEKSDSLVNKSYEIYNDFLNTSSFPNPEYQRYLVQITSYRGNNDMLRHSFVEAEAHYIEAMRQMRSLQELYNKTDYVHLLLTYNLNVGSSYSLRGDFFNAIYYYNKVFEIRNELASIYKHKKENIPSSIIWTNLLLVDFFYAALKKHEVNQDLFEKAIFLLKDTEDRLMYFQSDFPVAIEARKKLKKSYNEFSKLE